MDKIILQDVLDSIAHKRSLNETEEARRLGEIMKKHPDIHRLVEKRHQMVMASVRSIFTAGDSQMESRMEEYNREIRNALQQKGYPEDYLSPIYDCAVCEDTGFVYDESNRKIHCECLKKAYEKAVLEGNKGAFGVSFAAFDPLRFPETTLPGQDIGQREYMLLVKEKCQYFAGQLQGGSIQTLLLHGGSGLGKTYLLRCIEREAAVQGVSCAFVTAYDLLDALRSAYFGRENDAAEAYASAELLLIDDLGMEPLMENVTVEQIYHLLNKRLNQGLYTAISTNLSRTELQKRYTERVTSRLLDVRTGRAIPFLGSDIRLKK